MSHFAMPPTHDSDRRTRAIQLGALGRLEGGLDLRKVEMDHEMKLCRRGTVLRRGA